ncbi:hypothetical protein CEXT_570671 [Caerostris extrusa]|uniref:Uncharacterized protein n=1 Tax=Caerostris extrusa TaxID=172846 RepID=A0AAV4Y786_CAEEX|nr:hypothetical protein CEXT_570671 [Caerostris extrusa]
MLTNNLKTLQYVLPPAIRTSHINPRISSPNERKSGYLNRDISPFLNPSASFEPELSHLLRRKEIKISRSKRSHRPIYYQNMEKTPFAARGRFLPDFVLSGD